MTDKLSNGKPVGTSMITDQNRKIEEQAIQHTLRILGVPARFSSALLDHFPFSKMVNLKKSLYIYGNQGVGKTHLMIAILKEILSKTIRKELEEKKRLDFRVLDFCQYSNVPDLLFSIKQTYEGENKWEKEAEILRRYSNVDYLFLDDLGAERTSEWTLQTFYMILNHRYEEQKYTFITSNLELKQLENKLSERISSRIAGMCFPFMLRGNDRRLEK